MLYVVIKVGQLVEHDSLEEAIEQASRLIDKEGKNFYIAKLIKCGSKTKFEWQDLEHYENNYGAPWTSNLDKSLIKLWKSNDYTIAKLANRFGRTICAIESRLDKLGLYNYKSYLRM